MINEGFMHFHRKLCDFDNMIYITEDMTVRMAVVDGVIYQVINESDGDGNKIDNYYKFISEIQALYLEWLDELAEKELLR